MAIQIAYETENGRVDEVIAATIGLIEASFPDRIRAHYLVGSHVDGSAVTTSDIDLYTIFKCDVNDEERRRFNRVWKEAMALSSILLDLGIHGEESLASRAVVTLKCGSRFLYGEDIREDLELPPLDEYVRSWMHGPPLACIINLARGRKQITYPVRYPDPKGEFFGYDNNPIENRRDTKILMSIVAKISTALLAYRHETYVGSKSQCLRLYKEKVRNEWQDLIEFLFEQCNHRWAYSIPDSSEDRIRLRNACKRTLEYENYFLQTYRDFVLKELNHPNLEIRRSTLRRSNRVTFTDAEFQAALDR